MRSILDCQKILELGVRGNLIGNEIETGIVNYYSIHWGHIRLRDMEGGWSPKFIGKTAEDAYNKAADYVLSLYPKENVMSDMPPLAQVIDEIMEGTKVVSVGVIVQGGDDMVTVVAKAIRTRAAGRIPAATVETYIGEGQPVPYFQKEHAAIIITVSGPPTHLHLTVEKHRYGPMMSYSANIYAKDNKPPKETPMAYQYDNRSYADCFRVLRDAKGDGLIANYGTNAASITDGCAIAYIVRKEMPHHIETFADQGGTKGDIGILREAAAWVLAQKNAAYVLAQKKPDPNTMTYQECSTEIEQNGAAVSTLTGYRVGMPLVALALEDGNAPVTMSDDEMAPFLRRCVEYIRGQTK